MILSDLTMTSPGLEDGNTGFKNRNATFVKREGVSPHRKGQTRLGNLNFNDLRVIQIFRN